MRHFLIASAAVLSCSVVLTSDAFARGPSTYSGYVQSRINQARTSSIRSSTPTCFVGHSDHGYRGGHDFNRGRSGRDFYRGHGYRDYHGRHHSYRPHYDWHDTSHYDWHPGEFRRHGNHFDYIPGHYDFHRQGHWDFHH